MLKAKIKCHAMGTRYSKPHFFILSKGQNSGKPMPEFCPNCFVFLADDEEERNFYFFILQGLWELKLFKPFLIGSVVDYIRLGDLVDLIEETVNAVNTGERKHADVFDALFQIEFTRSQLEQKLHYLIQLRRALFQSYFKPYV